MYTDRALGRRRSGLGLALGKRLLAAACLQLLALPGARGLRRGAEGRPVARRCCCLGPSEAQCRLLRGSQLALSLNPAKVNKPVCPYSLGYGKYTRFGFKTPPATCAQPPQAEAVNITVKAYWMRHGWSCANVLQAQAEPPMKEKLPLDASFESAVRGLYADPSLTDAAVLRAYALGKPVRERILRESGGREPLVFSSAMVRAMETAIWNFPEWNVRPLPYIAETGMGPANRPLPWVRQIDKMLRAPTDEDKLRHVVFDASPADHRDRSSSKKSDYQAFRRYFPQVLSALLADEQVEAGAEVPVIFVSHSRYMRRWLGCGSTMGRKPMNNEVWVQTYTLELGAYDAVLNPVSCEELFDSTERRIFPAPPELLCEGDVGRCAEDGAMFRPKAWLKHDAPACAKSGDADFVVGRDIRAKEPYTELLRQSKR